MPRPGAYTGGGQSGHKPGLPTSTGKRRHTLRPSGSPLSPSVRKPGDLGIWATRCGPEIPVACQTSSRRRQRTSWVTWR
jgi:hypothetical protein